jgi:hypothetical protein
MGIIEKQATKNAIYSYLGASLGFFTVMWFAHSLTTAENGARGLLISYSALFAQFANLGFTSVTNRFFPYPDYAYWFFIVLHNIFISATAINRKWSGKITIICYTPLLSDAANIFYGIF